MIKAILFDVDGVLVDSRRANELYKKELLKQAGYDDMNSIIKNSFHKPMKQFIREVMAAKDISDEQEADRLFSLMLDPSLREFQAKHYKFPKDLRKTLEELRERFILGVVTSRIKQGVDEILSLGSIEKYFDIVISVDDVENYKPHPEPLEKHSKHLAQAGRSYLYRDSDTDIMAAHSAGMPSVHLSETMHESAHHHILDFSEITKAKEAIIKKHANDNS